MHSLSKKWPGYNWPEFRVHDNSFGFCLIHNNQEVPMDNFGKFQPHQTADDKVVKASGV